MSVRKGLNIVIPIVLEEYIENISETSWINIDEIKKSYSNKNFVYRRILTYITNTKDVAKISDKKLTEFSYNQKLGLEIELCLLRKQHKEKVMKQIIEKNKLRKSILNE